MPFRLRRTRRPPQAAQVVGLLGASDERLLDRRAAVLRRDRGQRVPPLLFQDDLEEADQGVGRVPAGVDQAAEVQVVDHGAGHAPTPADLLQQRLADPLGDPGGEHGTISEATYFAGDAGRVELAGGILLRREERPEAGVPLADELPPRIAAMRQLEAIAAVGEGRVLLLEIGPHRGEPRPEARDRAIGPGMQGGADPVQGAFVADVGSCRCAGARARRRSMPGPQGRRAGRRAPIPQGRRSPWPGARIGAAVSIPRRWGSPPGVSRRTLRCPRGRVHTCRRGRPRSSCRTPRSC